ncbi:MAG: DUF72 domain-containing protein [Saprospiraceae bacterium]|nr:DUF72 domain-containing protein [Saprospiraceae bacterium]
MSFFYRTNPDLRRMEFGKLPSVDSVDFTLPPEPNSNADFMRRFPANKDRPQIFLGATGYNMRAWVGKWYPAKAKPADYLRHYGAQFNTIEHNTTHYRIPDLATIERWREEVPDDFRYCPKIPQTISHARDLGLSGPEIGMFCQAIRPLGAKLGCCFLQLPPYFKEEQVPVLERFLRVFPHREIPLAVEVRHESFFQPSPASAYFFQLLENEAVPAVITDVAGRRDVCHMRLTSPCTMIRFVGNGLHPTDFSRLDAWANRLAVWFGQGLRSVYFFCHEPDNLLAPELTAYAATAFSTVFPRAILRGPKPEALPPQQGTLF